MIYKHKLNNDNINIFIKVARKQGKLHMITCCKDGNYFAVYSGKHLNLHKLRVSQ